MTLWAESVGLNTTKLYHGRVDEDAVAAFALATNDDNPRYLDGRSVPPLFTASLVGDAQSDVQGTSDVHRAVSGSAGCVHGEHDLRLWGAVLPGMSLCWTASTYSARRKSTGVVVVDRIQVSDQDGNPVAEHFWSNFYLRGTTSADYGPDSSDHSFPPEARSQPVATGTVQVDRDQTYRFAGISGDHVGHAIDDEIARSEGYPGKILQGMCSFGMVCGPLVKLLAGGDPTRIRRIAVRFSSPTFPKRELEVRTYAAGLTAEGGRAFAFETVQSGIPVHTHGRVELRT